MIDEYKKITMHLPVDTLKDWLRSQNPDSVVHTQGIDICKTCVMATFLQAMLDTPHVSFAFHSAILTDGSHIMFLFDEWCQELVDLVDDTYRDLTAKEVLELIEEHDIG